MLFDSVQMFIYYITTEGKVIKIMKIVFSKNNACICIRDIFLNGNKQKIFKDNHINQNYFLLTV